MAKLSNLVIFMSFFCCIIVAENEKQPNTSISEGKNDITESCDVEEQSKSCEKCNNIKACHFVIWESDDRKSNVTKCVDIKLNKAEVQELGPLGNDARGSHWSMKYQTNCSITPDSSDNGNTGNQGARGHSDTAHLGKNTTVTSSMKPKGPRKPGHLDTSHLEKNATIPATNKVPKQPKVSLTRGHSDTAHLGKNTTVTASTKPKSPRNPGHSDTSHLTQKKVPHSLKNSATANTATAPSSGFDAGSFVGGMVLVAAIGVLCFVAMRYYNRGNRGFNYLLSPNNRSDIMA